jgi:hypothetical protein
MRIRSVLKGVAALFAMSIAMTGVSYADTYVQTSDHCSATTGSAPGTGCGTTTGNFITVTQNAQAGTTTFSVTLAPGWAFVDTGANGSGGSLNFGFGSSLSNLTITNTSGNGWSTTDGKFSVQGGVSNTGATDTVSTALLQEPGQGGNAGNTFNFPNGIAITCNSSGGSSQCSTPLTFTISTLAALTADTSGHSFFWADVINNNVPAGTTPPTGLIDFTLQAVPLPPAALLFGSALAGLGFLTRRRRSADRVTPDFLEDYPSSQRYTPL